MSVCKTDVPANDPIYAQNPLKAWPECLNNVPCIFAGDYTVLTQATTTFSTFVAHQVSTEGLPVFCFSRCGDLKSPLHPFVCFLLWHFLNRSITRQLPLAKEHTGSLKKLEAVHPAGIVSKVETEFIFVLLETGTVNQLGLLEALFRFLPALPRIGPVSGP